jgi:cyclophilin family peptidyl-prolyl cis-trans isomerase
MLTKEECDNLVRLLRAKIPMASYSAKYLSLFSIAAALVLTSCTNKVVTNSNNTNSQNTTTTTDSQNINQPDPTISPEALLEQEKDLVLTGRTVVMETNFGTLNIEMLDKAAPKTTENFIRLTHRKYFDGLTFHRIAERENFSIIQGGDPLGNGRGGESAFGQEFEDEIFIENKPGEFIAPELYADFNGRYAVYKKGYVAMANAGPNTNGSQFFIMLRDTKLPPAYTIFGKITEKDFPVLDKILEKVDPVVSTGDGRPDKEIKIIEAKLL